MDEKVVIAIAVFFALSQISERIANIIKLYVNIPFLGNLRNEEKDPVKEKKRERGLITVSIISGYITILIFYSSICCFKESMNLISDLEWVTHLNIGGITLAALFVSFGSKFWHDILDIVLAYKNLRKETVYEKSVQNQQLNTGSLQELVDKYTDEYRDTLLCMEGVSGVMVTTLNDGTDKPCIQINLTNAAAEGKIKKFIKEKRIDEKIAIEMRVTGQSMVAIGTGSSIRNANTKKSGVWGCTIFDSSHNAYILSCWHVIRGNSLSSSYDAAFTDKQILDHQSSHIADVYNGWLDTFGDIGIAKIKEAVQLDNHPLNGFRMVKLSENLKGMTIFFWINGVKNSAIIDSVNVSTKISYPEGDKTLNQLISITTALGNNGSNPMGPGDSGTIVFDGNLKIIGMLIAVDIKYAYLCRVDEIKAEFTV